MANIVVLGGTGYTGSNIVAEAASRGHRVTSVSRSVPAEPVEGVQYETGSVLEGDTLANAIAGADVVIGSLAPRGELEGQLAEVYATAAQLAADTGARWGVVGGFSCLRPAPGAERIAFSGEVPEAYLAEAQTLARVLDTLIESAPAELDWFFVSPASLYGSYAPGEKLGHYRVTDDLALFDDDGNSAISGADFATAFIDEVETPTHHRAQLGFAY